jgi:LacI family transcriptional regulator
MKEMPKVILSIDTSTTMSRSLIRGIVKYSRNHGSWFFHSHVNPDEMAPKQIKKKFYPEGVIMRDRIENQKLLKLGLPTVVMVADLSPQPGVSNIITDDAAIGKMAGQHLLERGLESFAYFGDDKPWSRKRLTSFQEVLGKHGFRVSVCIQPRDRLEQSLTKNDLDLIADWLKALPKPIGLMAAHDECGQKILDVCKTLEIDVPKEVAVVGVDNDEFICDLSDPPLSSIATDAERAGYEAAKVLAKQMEHQKRDGKNIYIRPLYVVPRQSTDILNVQDEAVAKAIHCIRMHAREIIQVSDVVEAAGVSRADLYKRFHNVLGHSISSEIRYVRANEIARLLVETNMSISKIALSLGYHNTAHVARFFRHEKGITPLEYRKKYSVLKHTE